MGTPIGVTFNNPLNVRPDGKSNWQGMAGVGNTSAGQFLHMVDAPFGWRLGAANVIAHQDKWGHNSIAKLIGGSGTKGEKDYRPGWAPPEDNNNTAAYIASVVGMTGFAANALLNFHSYEHIRPVMVAMAEVEQGRSPYTWWTDAQIDKGLEMAGIKLPAKPMPTGRIVTAVGTATGVGATQVFSPTAPAPVSPPFPSTDIAPLEQAQTFFQQMAPYFKWAAVALCVVIVAGMALYWWRERQKRQQGLV